MSAERDEFWNVFHELMDDYEIAIRDLCDPDLHGPVTPELTKRMAEQGRIYDKIVKLVEQELG